MPDATETRPDNQLQPGNEPQKFLLVGGWILTTIMYAAFAPFIALGTILIGSAFAGTLSGEVRAFFAVLGTGTEAEFANFMATLAPIAWAIFFLVVAIRVVSNHVILEVLDRRMEEKIVAHIPDRLRSLHEKKLLFPLIFVSFAGAVVISSLLMTNTTARPVINPPSTQSEARATIIMPDGTIHNGRAIVDRDPSTGHPVRYAVTLQQQP